MASARRSARIRERATPSQNRLPTLGTSVASAPATTSSAAVVTAAVPVCPCR
ncbi:MAG: hypothetical protein HOW97_03375 [Catenulispora sp.]|nr:hypothetical protein [Catenulispora sp.]NUR57272.1 hypothetical protein [Catenulispora sp.]